MRRLLPVLLLLAVPYMLPGQNAVIEKWDESFRLQGPSSGVHNVSVSITVYNKDGLMQATPVLYTDSFRSIASFKAETVDAGSHKVKAGKKDLSTASISSSLADDGFVSVYTPSGRFPIRVDYEYSIRYHNGVISFPIFSPLAGEKVEIREASYRLDLPEGTEITSYSNKVTALPPSASKGREIHEWTVKDFPALVGESMMPSIREMIPQVFAAPVTFSFSGIEGSQRNWQESGRWLYSLQEGADVLPEETVKELQEMTRGCQGSLEKLQIMYSRLRERTRYVSIQLGIGGFKPISATDVEKRGFGDCKALSNYLRAMLKAVGVPSYYYIINTDKPQVKKDFFSVSQMNHAMLAVPLPELDDTVYVECTNPIYPLGYRHSGAAGHDVVFVSPSGGQLIRIPSYPDSLSRTVRKTHTELHPDGSADFSVERKLYLDYVEPYLGFADMKPETREKKLTAGYGIQHRDFKIGGVSDNFSEYCSRGKDFCPEMTILYSFSTRQYARREGPRLFVRTNPVKYSIAYQRGERVNDIVIDEPFTTVDSIYVKIPEGYEVESLPPAVALDRKWASFRSEAGQEGDGVLIIQSMTFNRLRADKSEYPEFRDFIRSVNKGYDTTIVLKQHE